MKYIYERKINYYETDKMGIVHHSNYIRFLEEARCYFLEYYGFCYSNFEELGIGIPVTHVDISYKTPVTYNDTLCIDVYIKKYTGVRLVVGYDVTNKETGDIVVQGETKHCFTSTDLKPINLKKFSEDFHTKYEKFEQDYRNSIKNNT